jgi:hypothetical protein
MEKQLLSKEKYFIKYDNVLQQIKEKDIMNYLDIVEQNNLSGSIFVKYDNKTKVFFMFKNGSIID